MFKSAIIKNNKLVLAILCIGFIPTILRGYSYYLLILLFPLLLQFKGSKRDLANLAMMFLFGISYVIPMWLRGEPINSNTIFMIVMPAIVYATAKYLCKRIDTENEFIGLILTIAFCLASWAIFMSIQDTITTGELINVSRNIEENGKFGRSATGYGMMFSAAIGGLGLFFAKPNTIFQQKYRIIAILISLIALFGCVHLVNRTGIVLALLSLLVCLFYNTFINRKIGRGILISILLSAVMIYAFSSMAFIQEVADTYTARNEGVGSVSTGGGRSQLWEDGISHIINNPLGADKLQSNQGSYAHNMWLDAGVIGGWIPFILLIIMTLRLLNSLIRLLKNKQLSQFVKMYILSLVAVVFAQAAVEPVIQGVFPFFLFIFFLWGMVECYLCRLKSKV